VPRRICARNALPVAQRTPRDFLWQQIPTALNGYDQATHQAPGIDYLTPYWTVRYSPRSPSRVWRRSRCGPAPCTADRRRLAAASLLLGAVAGGAALLRGSGATSQDGPTGIDRADRISYAWRTWRPVRAAMRPSRSTARPAADA
jgi:hypothetical protein